MGRNMFGPIRGEWDLNWTGWWGDFGVQAKWEFWVRQARLCTSVTPRNPGTSQLGTGTR